jgi:hypothetical protein
MPTTELAKAARDAAAVEGLDSGAARAVLQNSGKAIEVLEGQRAAGIVRSQQLEAKILKLEDELRSVKEELYQARADVKALQAVAGRPLPALRTDHVHNAEGDLVASVNTYPS